MAINDETGEEYTLDSSGNETGFFQSVGSGLAGAFNNLVGHYGTALGNRIDSFGNEKAAGVTDPAVQTRRNPLTGQLYQTNNPGANVGGSGFSMSPTVMLALAGLAVAAVFMLRR